MCGCGIETMGDKDQPFEILVIEDNPLDVHLIRESFREVQSPHNLHVVTDGEKALAFLHRGVEFTDAPRPHLVLLDLNVPEVSGFEVLAGIKEHEHLRDIPVIILTVSKYGDDVRRAYDLQANC